MAGSTRRNRLAESRRRLTKLLIIAALIEYGLQIGDIDVGKVVQDDIDEAADLAKHGSVHVPTVVINVQQFDRFERYVPAWSSFVYRNRRIGRSRHVRQWRAHHRFAASHRKTMYRDPKQDSERI